jgi:chemotaxis protein histidine kinase CheA
MSQNSPLCFLELTDFSYRFAVCPDRQQPGKIQEIHEFPLSEANRLAQLLPPASELICALRPKTRQAHLASGAEAAKFKGLEGLRQFAQQPERGAAEPAWFAGVQATDGQLPNGQPWLLSLSPADAQQAARALFANLTPKSARYLDATIITAGTLGSLVTTPTLLLEIGELASQAFLVSPRGVLATQTATLNLDQIAEAVQAEFNLKFRGSAAKLFFNPDCDFTDHAAPIAVRLTGKLKTDLASILGGQPAPAAFCCSGLPAAQHWLGLALAKELGLAPFAAPAVEAGQSPAWFNFLSLIKAQTSATNGLSPWLAEWQEVKAPLNVTTTPAAGKVAQVETTLVTGTAATAQSSPAPAPEKSAPLKAGPNFATAPTLPAKAGTPTPAVVITPPQPKASSPAPAAPPAKAVVAPAEKPAKQVPVAPAKTPAASTPQKKAAPEPAPVVKAAPAAAKPAPTVATARATVTTTETAPRKNRLPLFIGLGLAAAAVIVIGFFYNQSQNQKAEATRLAQEKQATEQRAQADVERARLEAEKIKKEAAAQQQQFVFETNQKLAAAEAARQQAENEAKQQTAARLASARGNLVIVTEPAGALVTVGDQPAAPAPVTLNYLKIGRYPVTIRQPRYDEVKLDLEVTENGTTNPGVIKLTRIAGALEITSDPAGTAYELFPANSPSFSIAAKLTGKTPATLTDLEPGDYTVTYTRSGWKPHSETITVARDGTARSAWTAPNGQIQITSEPAGATVTQNGVPVGRTPLTLAQPPGAVRYDVTMAGYDPVVLKGQSEEGKTLALTARLLLTDRVYNAAEVDVRPEPIKPALPNLPSELSAEAARTELQFVVGRDGTPRDIQVTKATNPALGKFYVEAVAKWKFKPGSKAGKPVNCRVMIPFVITNTGTN